MPRCRARLSALSLVVLFKEVLTSAATFLDRDPSSNVVILERRGTNVLDDPFFIPAIACIGAFVLICLVCMYFLGCCCNARKMDAYYARNSSGSRRNSAAYQRPTINLNSVDGLGKYTNVPPPRVEASIVPSPIPPSVRLQQLDGASGAQQHAYNTEIINPPQPYSHPPSTNSSPIMSVHHMNPTAASYPNRGYDRTQPSRVPVHYQPETHNRASTMSSATSSTQIGTNTYSPHQGNTLSYASSSPSMSVVPVPPVWDRSNVPSMPGEKEKLEKKELGGGGGGGGGGPPGYFDDKS